MHAEEEPKNSIGTAGKRNSDATSNSRYLCNFLFRCDNLTPGRRGTETFSDTLSRAPETLDTPQFLRLDF
ncbi:MAG: hypothetical protein RL069_800 [Planctomycetota bacterium]|jgi:hypothetical protein